MSAQRFRKKKPVVIEAQRYIGVPTTPGNQPESPADAYAREIVEWSRAQLGGPNPEDAWESPRWPLFIETLERRMCVEVGDWVIRGVAGEFYPCKPDIFEATYEPADDGPAKPPGDRTMNHQPTTSGISESLAWVICACGHPSVVQRFEYADSATCIKIAAKRLSEHIAEANAVPQPQETER